MQDGKSIGKIVCALTLSCLYVLNGCLSNDSGTSRVQNSSLPQGTVNQPYFASLIGSGGKPPYTWAVSPALPTELALNATTGEITGTPAVEGTSSHTFSLTDSSSPPQVAQITLGLTINSAPLVLSITTTSLPDGFIGQAYNQPVQAAGGTVPLSWSLIAGTIPQNLGLNSTTGVISGIPTASGTSSFTVRVADAAGQEDTQALSIGINPASPPDITTLSLPGGTVGLPYSEALSATGGTGVLIWSLSAGSLPTNLALSGTGTISGTPTVAGISNFTVKVIDSLAQSDTQSLSIAISTALTITTSSPLPDAEVGKSYSKTLQRSGGISPFIWSVTPALPPGLNLEEGTGKISGIPVMGTAGTYNLTFTVEDSSTPTPQTATKQLSLKIKS
jgi:Putative Ig domain